MAHAVAFAVFVLLCVVQLGVSQKTTTTPPVTKGKDRHGCEVRDTSAFHREMCSLCVVPVIGAEIQKRGFCRCNRSVYMIVYLVQGDMGRFLRKSTVKTDGMVSKRAQYF